MFENIRIHTLHQQNIILSEFKWTFFEIYVAWTTRNHEAKIYVNNMPICVNQNIIIVTIFDLENVLKK